jgi:hypothetical protein
MRKIIDFLIDHRDKIKMNHSLDVDGDYYSIKDGDQEIRLTANQQYDDDELLEYVMTLINHKTKEFFQCIAKESEMGLDRLNGLYEIVSLSRHFESEYTPQKDFSLEFLSNMFKEE